MLGLDSLKQFYFLPELHDMRYDVIRVLETVRIKYGRNPYNGDVYIYMSKNRRRIRMVHFEDHAFYFHENTYKKAFKFMKLEINNLDMSVFFIKFTSVIKRTGHKAKTTPDVSIFE